MNLIEAMRSEFGKSKRWYNRGLFLSVCLLILSLIVIFIKSGDFAVITGLGLMILPVLSFVFREKSIIHQDRAENIRHLLMLSDGLGYKPSALELTQLELDLGQIDKSEPLFKKPYYDSKLPMGTKRLADIIAESSFFTKNLSKKSALIFLISIFLGLSILFVVLYITLNFGITRILGEMFAKCIAIVMVFLVSGDFAFLWRRYYCLSLASEQVLLKSDALRRSREVPLEEIMKVMDDYNCAVIQAPPILGIVYKYMLGPLNKAWREQKISE